MDPAMRSDKNLLSHASGGGARLSAVAVVVLALLQRPSQAFGPSCSAPRRFGVVALHQDKQDESEKDLAVSTMDPFTKASWYAVEAFGKVFGTPDRDDIGANAIEYDKPPESVEETMRRIRADNDREYFLSGKVDALIYDNECIFADPFVSFVGRDRFVDNLRNLGSFITKYSAKLLDYDDNNGNSTAIGATTGNAIVETRFMVKLQLNLPWKPVLAWPWGVRCEIDRETKLIVLHQEKWDIEALEVGMFVITKETSTVFVYFCCLATLVSLAFHTRRESNRSFASRQFKCDQH
jgi:hypothetical protein